MTFSTYDTLIVPCWTVTMIDKSVANVADGVVALDVVGSFAIYKIENDWM